jgi:hypothetical protein
LKKRDKRQGPQTEAHAKAQPNESEGKSGSEGAYGVINLEALSCKKKGRKGANQEKYADKEKLGK